LQIVITATEKESCKLIRTLVLANLQFFINPFL
jgi:hypothetical protein